MLRAGMYFLFCVLCTLASLFLFEVIVILCVNFAYMLWKSVGEQCGCLTPHNCFDEHGHWFGEFVNYV